MNITDLKKSAKLKLTGNYIKCASSSLLYFIIISLLTYCQTKATNSIENPILLSIIQAIFLLINWVLGYGIIANILDLVDIKTNSITDFINSSLKKGLKYTKIGLFALYKLLPALLLFIFVAFYLIGNIVAKINKADFLCFKQNLVPLASILWIISTIFLVYFILKYALITYIFHENPNMTEKEIVEKSNKLMKGNKPKFILLLLSFLHWFLLGALILSILNIFIKQQYLTPFITLFYSIIRPYIVVSKSEFYKELINKEEA